MADEKIKTTRRVPTISVTVIRDGKRVTPPVNKAYGFTDDEIKAVTAQHPTAFRKPVNEDPDPATTPENKEGATATETPKKRGSKAAAEKDSAAKEVTGNVKPAAGEQGGTSDDDADEDDDI